MTVFQHVTLEVVAVPLTPRVVEVPITIVGSINALDTLGGSRALDMYKRETKKG